MGKFTLGDLVDDVDEKLLKLQDKSISFDKRINGLSEMYARWDDLSVWEKVKLRFRTRIANKFLQMYEGTFLDKDGLNDREWFKHQVFASGRFTGYNGQELPGLAEALEDKNFEDYLGRLRKFQRSLDILLVHF